MLEYDVPGSVSCEIDDPVEVRETESIKGAAGSKGRDPIWFSRGVDEEEVKDFREDILVEREKGARGHLCLRLDSLKGVRVEGGSRTVDDEKEAEREGDRQRSVDGTKTVPRLC